MKVMRMITEPFLEDEKDLGCHKLEVIEGDKEGSKWLVLDEVYIYTRI